MQFKGCFYAAACGWSMLFLLSCCKNITLVYSNSTLGKGRILHCLWIRFGLQSVMYMDVVGGCIEVCNCQCGEESSLSTADSDFTDVQSLLFPPAFFPPSLILFSAFHFFTQGENEEEQNQHMKTKTWQRGEGRGEEQRKERQSQKTRGLSKVRDES